MLGDAELWIENSLFENNVALKMGGVISAESFKSLKISGGSVFKGNRAINQSGEIIYAVNSMGNIEFSGSKISQDDH